MGTLYPAINGRKVDHCASSVAKTIKIVRQQFHEDNVDEVDSHTYRLSHSSLRYSKARVVSSIELSTMVPAQQSNSPLRN